MGISTRDGLPDYGWVGRLTTDALGKGREGTGTVDILSGFVTHVMYYLHDGAEEVEAGGDGKQGRFRILFLLTVLATQCDSVHPKIASYMEDEKRATNSLA